MTPGGAGAGPGGGAGGKLGELYVELKVAGLEQLSAKLEMTTQRIRRVGEVLESTYRTRIDLPKLGEAFGQLSQSALAFGQSVAAVHGPLYGLAMAGINASSAGQLLSLQFTELSRQIGSVFAPTVRYISDRIAELIRWFHSLNGEQQRNLRTIGLVIAGVTTVGTVLPMIIRSVSALAAGIRALSAAMLLLNLTNPFTLIAVAITAVITGLTLMNGGMQQLSAIGMEVGQTFKTLASDVRAIGTTLSDVTKAIGLTGTRGLVGRNLQLTDMMGITWINRARSWQSGLIRRGMDFASDRLPQGAITRALRLARERLFREEKPEDREELAPALGGMESVTATYNRIALASRRVGDAARSPEQEQADLLRQIYQAVDTIRLRALEDRSLVGR